MVRFNVTQTVWKNSEDEILKAAVQKYGLNQWGRVASLFARRSARQCKARWDEWLDPNIKKTEWSREEDESLLHLAKLMPTQWRTIAPLVGRTAAQSLERYERLLDAAAGHGEEEEEEEEVAGEEGEEGGSSKKRKRVATAETLPAKPDAQDMDEEELEMLSEARARLANTLGKKAKRKARERQLEEQQRIAQLQKRRELKAAGVAAGRVQVADNRKRRRKNSDAEHIDYTQEVAFEQVAPTGPYDVSKEKLESARRERDEKARIEKLAAAQEARKQQAKKQKNKSTTMGVKDLEAKLAAERRKNEEALRVARSARAPLTLPEPQVSDMELEDVAKASSSAFAAPPLPINRKRSDVIAQEARNQLARDGHADLRIEGDGTGWKGALPSAADSVGKKGGLASLASRRTFAGANGRVIVLRDELGLNKQDDESNSSTLLEDAEGLASEAVRGLKTALSALPAPEYEVTLQQPKRPKNDVDDDDEDNKRVPDARERERFRQRTMEEKQKRVIEAMPSAVKLKLPDVPIESLQKLLSPVDGDPARKLILEEMVKGLVSGHANSIVDATALPELREVFDARLDESAVDWSELFTDDDYGMNGKPLEIFVACRAAAARIAKESEQITQLVEKAISQPKKEAEAQIVSAFNLFKQTKKLSSEKELSAWKRRKEEAAVELRVTSLQREVEAMSQKEAELQRQYAERAAT